MSSFETFTEYNLDLLLEDANKFLTEMKRRVYCDILVCYPHTFDLLPKILDNYGDRKRSHWTVTVSECS